MLCAIFRALPSLTSFTLIYSVDGRFICPSCIDVLTFVQLFQVLSKVHFRVFIQISLQPHDDWNTERRK